MTTITLRYYFGREDEDSFDYQVEVNYANYLNQSFKNICKKKLSRTKHMITIIKFARKYGEIMCLF